MVVNLTLTILRGEQSLLDGPEHGFEGNPLSIERISVFKNDNWIYYMSHFDKKRLISNPCLDKQIPLFIVLNSIHGC